MKKQKLQKLMLAGIACGMAVAAQANAQSVNQGETILLAGGGCGHNGGSCGGHASNNTPPRNSNGCSTSSRDNQIAAEDQGAMRSGNGCNATPANSCNGRVKGEYEKAGNTQGMNSQGMNSQGMNSRGMNSPGMNPQGN